ncbi:hypothetical protein E0K89_004225 [Aquicoccus sp. SCR17]|nr:hypothetical protein [Carideicomes alvinocaridis]
MKHCSTFLARCLSLGLAGLAALSVPAGAESGTQDVAALDQQIDEGLVRLDVLPGWRLADGRHVAGLRLRLEPGWKTYWRAPGDAGIPPDFDWSGSRNIAAVEVNWPRPKVFDQNGMTSIGYAQEVVLPVVATPRGAGPLQLRGEVDIGVCKDICVPETLQFDAALPVGGSQPDPRIAAALADRPFTAAEAQVQSATCRFRPERDGLHLSAELRMPPAGGNEYAVIETGNPLIWVAEAETRREGGTLRIETRMQHVEGRSMALDRDALRITVLGSAHAVDIRGCAAP